MEGARSRKWLWITAAVVVVALFGIVFWGPGLAASYYNKQGVTALGRGDFAGAKPLFDRSLLFTKNNPIAYAYLGEIALGKKALDAGAAVLYPDANYQDAVADFEKALSLGLENKDKTLHAVVLNDSGFAYWTLNEKEKADEKFLGHIAAFPDGAFASRYFLASDYFNRLNKPDEARQILLPALNAARSDFRQGNLFRVFALLARIYAFWGDNKDAEAFAKSAIATAGVSSKGSDIQVAHVILAQIFAKNGDLATAKKEIQKANDLSGWPKQYDCSLAVIYSLVKQYSLAIEVASSKGKPSQPSQVYAPCLNALAQSYRARNDTANEKKYLQEYIDYVDSLPEKSATFVSSAETAKEELKKLQ